MPKALERVSYAVARQSTVGWNPEINGPDTGYGALGVSSALHFVQWLPDSSATPSLMSMLSRAIDWERSRIADDGWINWAGNTRTCVPREGMKDPGYSTMADHLGAWGVMEDRPDLFAPAAAALAFARANPARRCEDRGGTPPGGTWSAPALAGGGSAGVAAQPGQPARAAGATGATTRAGGGSTARSAPVDGVTGITCPAIPRLTGATLATAKRRIAKAGCTATPLRTVGASRRAPRRVAGRAQARGRRAHKRATHHAARDPPDARSRGVAEREAEHRAAPPVAVIAPQRDGRGALAEGCGSGISVARRRSNSSCACA